MIIELINKNRFKENDELYIKYFGKQKNNNELEKTKEINKKITNFTKKLFNNTPSYYYDVDYRENIGYYTLIYGDRGFYYFDYLTDVEEYAFLKIIDDILFEYAHYYELENRLEIFNKFKEKFGYLDNGIEEFYNYASAFGIAEYKLEAYNEFYDNKIPDIIIQNIVDRMNNYWFNEKTKLVWEYDNKTKELTCRKKQKVMAIGGIK